MAWGLFHRDPKRIVGVLRVTLLNRLNNSTEWAELPFGRQTLHHDWLLPYRGLQASLFVLSLGIELTHFLHPKLPTVIRIGEQDSARAVPSPPDDRVAFRLAPRPMPSPRPNTRPTATPKEPNQIADCALCHLPQHRSGQRQRLGDSSARRQQHVNDGRNAEVPVSPHAQQSTRRLRPSAELAHIQGLRLSQQPRQLRHVGRDPPRVRVTDLV